MLNFNNSVKWSLKFEIAIVKENNILFKKGAVVGC